MIEPDATRYPWATASFHDVPMQVQHITSAHNIAVNMTMPIWHAWQDV